MEQSNNELNQQHLELYLAFCQGDQRASKELVNAYTLRLLNYMRRAFSERQAGDYVQSTWLKLVEYCGNKLRHSNFGAFIMSIAKNVAIDEYRKSKTLKRSDISQYEVEVTQIDQNKKLDPLYFMHVLDDKKQDERRLKIYKEALAQLPSKQRQVLLLQHSGHSLAVIADITGAKKETVKSQLRYAKNELKKQLCPADTAANRVKSKV